MARNFGPPDPTIGQRIAARRNLRGWSISYAASRAGIAHSTWSRIERGLRGADNRFMLAQIAAALDCSTMDLVGQPVPAVADADSVSAYLAVAAIRQALIETEIGDPVTVAQPRPIEVLADETALVVDLKLRCDYAGAGRLLPRLLRELHAAVDGTDRAAALGLLVRAANEAVDVLKGVGFPAEAWLAAERAHQAAIELDDPVMLALAAWARGHSATSCGSYDRAQRIAEAAITAAEHAYGRPGGPEVLGGLHLLSAFSSVAQGRVEDAYVMVAEADRIAEHTGDSAALGLAFGPTNINIWRLSMEVDGGEARRALEIARETTPGALDAPTRLVTFYFDTGRALAHVGQLDGAVRMMLTAERASPQGMHSWGRAREAVRTLLGRVKGDAAVSLRGLAERMGAGS
jgi:transcriptional regulator with XRE-family HTH domain